MDADYDRLISSVSHNDLSFESTQIADRMDQWILAWLNHRDTQGKGLALNLLLDRVSHFNTMVTSRIIQDKINELEIRNNMVPPLPFCWISMGSDARGEQVVRTDQDNALIYADPSKENKTIAFDYFKALAREVTQGLDQFGFTLCKGNVMATNPDWCRPLGHWLRALDNWVGSTDPDAVRKLTILLDFKAIFGDRRLAATLHARVFQNFNAHSSASHLLVRDDQLFAAPKTRFNRINTRQKPGCKSCFNIKTQAIAHIVNGARLFAVNHGIQIPSTLKRLERLRDESILTQTEFDTLTHAGRIPIFPVIPLALDCACLPSASGSSNALLYKMIAA
ncbi:MAG: hypothetical protein HUK40_16395 [Desulfobacter sp.]|nr:hypothetical protein [Desulfobacter sp.]